MQLDPPRLIPVDQIHVPPNAPALREAHVLRLMRSIVEHGQLAAVVTTQSGGLVAGAHRLESCRRLRRPVVAVSLSSDSKVMADVVRAEENLARIARVGQLATCLGTYAHEVWLTEQG